MNLTQLHKKLKSDGLISFNRQYLSKITSEGKIPFILNDNGRKIFKYVQAVKALTDGNHVKIADCLKDPTVESTKIFKQHYQGLISKQKHDIEAGILVYRDEVEQKAFEVGRVIRNQLLLLPERLTADLTIANTPEDAEAILRKEIEIILQGFTPESLLS